MTRQIVSCGALLGALLGAGASLAQDCVAGDSASPVVAIAYPIGGATFAGRIVSLRGTISDEAGIASATLQLRSGNNPPRELDLSDYLAPDSLQPNILHFDVTDIDLALGSNSIAVAVTDRACSVHGGRAEITVTAAAPPATLNLYALALEVTQATQGTNSADGIQKRARARAATNLPALPYDGGELVAHKRTLVRAYAIAEGAGGPVRGVPARLIARRGSEVVELLSLDANLDPADDVREGGVLIADHTLFQQREHADNSWNFILPYSLTGAGSIDALELVVNPPDLGAVAECSGCNDGANVLRVTSVSFTATEALRVRPLPFVHDPSAAAPREPQADADLRTFCGTYSHMQPLADGCGRGLGIELLPPRRQSMAASGLLDDGVDMFDIETAVCALMASDRDTDRGSFAGPTVYFGIVPTGTSGALPEAFGSSASGHPHRSACAAALEVTDSTNSPAAIAAIAQEIAHGFLHADISGLGHVAWHACGDRPAYQLPTFPAFSDPFGTPLPPASIGQFGIDPWNLTVFSPRTTIDFMGFDHCAGQAWISPFTWQQLLDRWRAAVSASADETVVALGGAQDRAFSVTGFVRADGTLEMAPLFALPRPTVLTQPLSGDLSFILRDGAGIPLFAVSFGLTGHPDLPGGGTFAFGAPLLDRTARIDVQRGASVLLSLPVTANLPQVTVIHPNGGEQWGSAESNTIEWDASDADGDPLWYLVQYSIDGGQHWQTLATGLQQSSLALDTASLPGSDQALVRVFASDGVNTTVDESDLSFVVARKQPRLSITAAGATAIVERQSTLSLLAGYLNVDDPAVAPDAIGWSAEEIDAVAGPRLDLDGDQLSPGLHQITATAPGNDGGAVGRQLTVLRAPRLSDLRSTTPAACVGDCDASGEITVDEIITGVSIALGTLAIDDCDAFDANDDAQVTVDEILQAVNSALTGCP